MINFHCGLEEYTVGIYCNEYRDILVVGFISFVSHLQRFFPRLSSYSPVLMLKLLLFFSQNGSVEINPI